MAAGAGRDSVESGQSAPEESGQGGVGAAALCYRCARRGWGGGATNTPDR